MYCSVMGAVVGAGVSRTVRCRPRQTDVSGVGVVPRALSCAFSARNVADGLSVSRAICGRAALSLHSCQRRFRTSRTPPRRQTQFSVFCDVSDVLSLLRTTFADNRVSFSPEPSLTRRPTSRRRSRNASRPDERDDVLERLQPSWNP